MRFLSSELALNISVCIQVDQLWSELQNPQWIAVSFLQNPHRPVYTALHSSNLVSLGPSSELTHLALWLAYISQML